MGYIIYKTIGEEDFTKMHDKVYVLRSTFEEFLSARGFKITNESDLADILGLDFVSYGTRYDGNIGFLFDDEDPNNYTFTFYVTKSFDEDKKRHSKRENIAEGVDLKYIEENQIFLLNKAVEVYDNMKDEDLTKITILR